MSDSRVREIIASELATPSALGLHVTPGTDSFSYSPLRKKKSLFLIMGPPTRAPKFCELLSFAPVTGFPSTVLPVKDFGRIYVYTEALKLLSPLFVTALMLAPV